MVRTWTPRVMKGLLIFFQFNVVVSRMTPVSGVHQTASPAESGATSRQRMWPSRLLSGAPGIAADKRNHYRDQHQTEESDVDLVMEEGDGSTTQIVDTDHTYYTSKIYSPGDTGGKELWVNVDQMEEQESKVHGFLSNTYRQAERVNLSFGFPFYGHILKEVTVTTGGFIYTGDVIHQLLTATQYIAPLMANFDPSLSRNSSVFYIDNGTALLVQWNQIYLLNVSLGTFSFQTVLHSDGRIVFTYKEIPIDISDIRTENHPVKVGLSDAFVVLHELEQIPNVRRRTIYEYHKVEIIKSKISNLTSVEMTPLPTCLQFSSCGPCVTSQIGFNCSWCSRLQRCSSGFDRNRQDWVDLGCPEERRDPRCLREADVPDETPDAMMHTTTTVAAATVRRRAFSMTSDTPDRTSTVMNPHTTSITSPPSSATSRLSEGSDSHLGESEERLQFGLLTAIVTVMVVMATVVLVSLHIYHRPTSSLSLFFMERRPTRWPIMKFRRGSGHPSYKEVGSPGLSKDSAVVIDPKQTFVLSDRRESEQKDGFIVPDQKERFLVSDSS